MKPYTAQPEANRKLAAEQTHNELHGGRGVMALPTHEEIAKRAYDIYVKNGRKQGQSSQNWHQAEQELQAAEHRLPRE